MKQRAGQGSAIVQTESRWGTHTRQQGKGALESFWKLNWQEKVMKLRLALKNHGEGKQNGS